MDARKRPEPKPSTVLKDIAAADDDASVEEEEEERCGGEFGFGSEKKKKVVFGGGSGKKGSGGSSGGGSGGVSPRSCQAEKCAADLTEAKRYHRRHKVCELHGKASEVIVAGLRQRFCQQCSRFHELSEFDDTKRSCRRRLAGHNERRRKSSSESSHGEGPGRRRLKLQLNGSHRRQAEDRGRTLIAAPGNATPPQFHIG